MSLESVGSNAPEPISADLRQAFAPANHYVREWTEYYAQCPKAACLRVGTQDAERVLRMLRTLYETGFAAFA